MKLITRRYCLQIVPETNIATGDEIDIAYIEEILGLKKNGDSVSLIRRDVAGLSSIAYLETVRWVETKVVPTCAECQKISDLGQNK